MNALNNKDHVVGDDINYASGYHRYAFLYDGSAITALNSLLPSNVQLDLRLVWDISDAGHIATAGFWNFNAFTILLVPETINVEVRSIIDLVGQILFGVIQDGGGLIRIRTGTRARRPMAGALKEQRREVRARAEDIINTRFETSQTT